MAKKETPVSQQAKQLLLDEMQRQGVSRADLTRLLKITPQQVTRLCDLNWTTKIDTIAKALKLLGRAEMRLRLIPLEPK